MIGNVYRNIWKLVSQLNLNGESYLNMNDAYSFWKQVAGLIICGHTGTNVMDLQLLLVKAVASNTD